MAAAEYYSDHPRSTTAPNSEDYQTRDSNAPYHRLEAPYPEYQRRRFDALLRPVSPPVHPSWASPMPHSALDEVPREDEYAVFPTADTFHDESIAGYSALTYPELGSKRIRLVKMVQGPSGSTIGCEVKVCFLDQAPDYTAVSYTWGSPLGFHEIRVEGRPYSIPKNLWRFLDQVRKLPQSNRLAGWLWIDALSIDQSDPREKLEQVGIISSIFGNAGNVIVWLGPPYANSDRALAAVYPNSTTKPRRDSRTLASPIWSSLHSLCERPYWRRLWVYQELKSARRVELMCGHRLVPLRNFQEYLFDIAALRLDDKLWTLRKSSAGTMLNLIARPPGDSLWSLIQKTDHLRCSDPRDKAYALLSAVLGGSQGIEADYTITVPVLLNRILENMHNIATPVSLIEVAEQCRKLERLFGEPPNSMFVTQGPITSSRHISPLQMLADTRHLPNFGLEEFLKAWCVFYSHKATQQLVLPPSKSRASATDRSQRAEYIRYRHGLAPMDARDEKTRLLVEYWR